MVKFSIIAAVARDGAIGQQGRLPWRKLRKDMGWFRAVTRSYIPLDTAQQICKQWSDNADIVWYEGNPHNTLIMGRSTHRSIPYVLQGRNSIVLSRNPLYMASTASSFDEALRIAHDNRTQNIFVIGGSEVFRQAIIHPDLERLYITEIDAVYPLADRHFPVSFGLHLGGFTRKFSSPYHVENGIQYLFSVWER